MHQENQDNDFPNFDSATEFHELVPDCRNLIFSFVFHQFTAEDLASFLIKNYTPESISNLKFALNYFKCHATLDQIEDYLPMPDLYSLSLPDFHYRDIPRNYFGQFNHLVELDLFDDGNYANEMFQHLGSLEVLKLSAKAGFHTLSDEIFTYLKHLRQLQISDSWRLTDRTFENLYNAGSRLETLEITNCRLSDEAFAFLEGHSLQELILCQCDYITGEGLRHLSGVERLILIEMHEFQCHEAFKNLQNTLQSLIISNSVLASFDEEAVSYLKGVSTLILDGTQCDLTTASFVHLEGSIKRLELENLDLRFLDSLLWYLSGIEHVKLLDTGIRIEAEDLPHVEEVFRNVVSCEVSPDFADASTLKELQQFIEGNGGCFSCADA